MKNGCLYEYIYYPETGLDEDICKVLFYKIFNAIKKCHDSNICIRDIKLENILLDDNYNPILCDFGLGKISENKITGKNGTPNYMAPEVFLNKEPYNGFKVDIFNLAIALYILITGKTYFRALIIDDTIKLLFKKDYPQFWKKLGDIENKLSEEFKQLFIQMTFMNPSERISINEVLENVWFKDLNDEKIKEFEKKIKLKEEFDKRKEKVINGRKTEKKFEMGKDSSLLDDRGGDEECQQCQQYFNRDLKIKSIDKDSIRENYVEIKGKYNPYYFMDKLYNEIIKNFGDDYQFEKENIDNQKSLKFNIILNEEIYINDDEIEEKNEEVEKNNIFEKNLKIEVKMFKTKDGHLIRFRKEYGELYDYYENVKKIISTIDEL